MDRNRADHSHRYENLIAQIRCIIAWVILISVIVILAQLYYVTTVLSTEAYLVHSYVTEFGICLMSYLALSAVWSRPCPLASSCKSTKSSTDSKNQCCVTAALRYVIGIFCVCQHQHIADFPGKESKMGKAVKDGFRRMSRALRVRVL